MLVQYFRRGGRKRMRTKVRGERVIKEQGLGGGIRKGLFVAFMEDAELKIGWSLCNVKAGDVFEEERAKTIAIGRARKSAEDKGFGCPPSMEKKAKKFVARAETYFKKDA